jgi:uncharacterized protein (TIGR03000 family)
MRHGSRKLALGIGLSLCLGSTAWGQDNTPPRNAPDEQRIIQETPPSPITTPVAQPAKAPALMKILVPANSQIWIETVKMTTTGPVRLFQSPPLEGDKAYVYKVKVSWPTLPGQPDFVSEQEVTVKAGQTTTVDYSPLFKAAANPPSQPPATPAKPASASPAPQGNPQAPVQPPGRLPLRRQYQGRGGN